MVNRGPRTEIKEAEQGVGEQPLIRSSVSVLGLFSGAVPPL